MTEDEVISRYRLSPDPADLAFIRSDLDAYALRKRAGDADADTQVLKALAVTLFAAGDVHDCLEVWRAKRSSFDAGFSIDVQLLCGAGLSATKQFLARHGSDEAGEALAYLNACEAAGDFEGGDDPGGRLSGLLQEYRVYYGLP